MMVFDHFFPHSIGAQAHKATERALKSAVKEVTSDAISDARVDSNFNVLGSGSAEQKVGRREYHPK